jgi:AraC-like DNA-binding protein
MKNKILIWNDLKLFYGSNPRPVTKHSHPVVQLVLGTKCGFLSKDNEGDWIEKKGLLIAPNYFHECDASNVHILSIDIDPDSILGEFILNKQLSNEQILDYSSKELEQFDFEGFSKKLADGDWKGIRTQIENFFSFQKSEIDSLKDDRIESILSFISENIDGKITTEKMQEVAFLSESRMLHLFKEKMGLPIRNYILWYRLKIVFEQLIAGYPLTDAAYKAGFADQAHLTRTFTKMVGVPPSVLIKNSKFVQVSFPN